MKAPWAMYWAMSYALPCGGRCPWYSNIPEIYYPQNHVRFYELLYLCRWLPLSRRKTRRLAPVCLAKESPASASNFLEFDQSFLASIFLDAATVPDTVAAVPAMVITPAIIKAAVPVSSASRYPSRTLFSWSMRGAIFSFEI